MIMLSSEEQATLRAILNNYVSDQHYKVVVFGSRATGKARKYSDIDLALIGDTAVPPEVSADLSETFENSTLPYTVDIIDFTKASGAFRNEIKKEGVELVLL